MGKIIIGCWDCEYCGTDRISGDLRECPNCGRPRDKDVKFYMADPKNYAKDQENVNKDPDWLCPYCNSLNAATLTTCPSCGAVRDANTQNYFENRKAQEAEKAAPDTAQKQKEEYQKTVAGRKSKKKTFLLFAILAALIVLLVVLFLPKSQNMEIKSCGWERKVEVEEYKEFSESSWTLPDGAYNVTQKTELYGYNSVLDRYETRTRQVAESVLDGYDTSYSYRDLGNGRFEEVENQIPRYKTVYRTETYQEPVYKSVPVYETKYYYLIMRWVSDGYEVTSGTDDEPYFAELDLDEWHREGAKTEKYWVVDSKDNTYQVKYDLWKQLSAGQKIKGKVQFGELIGIE